MTRMAKELSLKDLLEELAEQRNFDFRGYKETTLERRFRRRMSQLEIGSYKEYGEHLLRHAGEINELVNTLLINATGFFRDPPAWAVLGNEILPGLLRGIKPGHSFRVWSAGCASGEEPYSIAILLSEHFGRRIQDYDVKIYATDIDEEALNAARRGEYTLDAARSVPPEWRDKYFHGQGRLRVNSEIRRLVIFGRSNLVHDAPISHVNLLVCRNLLIYFEPELQNEILTRLHYALEPGGLLFLGESESVLTQSKIYRRLNRRAKIFEPIQKAPTLLKPKEEPPHGGRETAGGWNRRQEPQPIRPHHSYLLETLPIGVLYLGADDVIVESNLPALTLAGAEPVNLAGRRLAETDLWVRIPDLALHLETARLRHEPTGFECHLKAGPEVRLLKVSVRPVLDLKGQRAGTLICIEDRTVEEKLEAAVEALESTGDELRAAKEELETTNEELESTNEELGTTNEGLQSTNEELETTNEELQSLNEELETTNQELEERTQELDQANRLYAEMLEKIRLPVMLLDGKNQIEFWNQMALRLFGFKSRPAENLTLDELPVSEELRNRLRRRLRTVVANQQPMVARDQFLGGRLRKTADIHFCVVPREDSAKKVLLMFEPSGAEKANPGTKTGMKERAARKRKRR